MSETLKSIYNARDMLDEMSNWYLTLEVSIILISIIWIGSIIYMGTVSKTTLVKLTFWFFIASPVTFFIAEAALSTLQSYEESYFKALWANQYGDATQNLTLDSLFSKAMVVAQNSDIELIKKLKVLEFIHGFFKYFIPALLLAFGTWASVKFLDSAVKVE